MGRPKTQTLQRSRSSESNESTAWLEVFDLRRIFKKQKDHETSVEKIMQDAKDMVNLKVSEAWNDLGYPDKKNYNKELHASKTLQKLSRQKIPKHQHEPLSQTLLRKDRNLSLLRAHFDQDFNSAENRFTIQIMNRKIDVWPASGIWYSHSKSKYGRGIEQLCEWKKKEHEHL